MSYDYKAKKTVIAIATELPSGRAANVIGHLAVAAGHRINADDMGRAELLDASGIRHPGISKYPVIVVTAKATRLRRLAVEARALPALMVIDFPEQMLNTAHDDELAEQLAAAAEADLKYLGVALHGAVADVRLLTGKFSLWGSQQASPL